MEVNGTVEESWSGVRPLHWSVGATIGSDNSEGYITEIIDDINSDAPKVQDIDREDVSDEMEIAMEVARIFNENSDKTVSEENTNNNKSDELSAENYIKNQLNILLDDSVSHDDIEAVPRSLHEIQDILPAILLETCAGQVVQILRAHSHDIIAGLATEIFTKWKIIVDEWSESTLNSRRDESVQRETICDSNAVVVTPPPSTSESSLSTLEIDPDTRQALNNLKKHRLNDFENCTNMKKMRMEMIICSPIADIEY